MTKKSFFPLIWSILKPITIILSDGYAKIDCATFGNRYPTLFAFNKKIRLKNRPSPLPQVASTERFKRSDNSVPPYRPRLEIVPVAPVPSIPFLSQRPRLAKFLRDLGQRNELLAPRLAFKKPNFSAPSPETAFKTGPSGQF